MASEALKRLKEGNQYYVSHRKNPSEWDEKHRKELAINGQRPYAVIITCADSRVVPEHIFSAGIGDLFIIRNAGNVVGDHEIGSTEYAVEHLGAPLVVVMGHTHCGAVETAIKGNADSYVKSIVDKVKKAMGDSKDPRECEEKNAKAGVKALLETTILSRLVAEGKLTVVSALYDIETGVVTFME